MGRYTYDLYQLSISVIFPRNMVSGVAYCRILLHDTMLNNDSYRTGTADTSVCDWTGTGNIRTFLNVNVEFKVTIQEQVHYRGTLQY